MGNKVKGAGWRCGHGKEVEGTYLFKRNGESSRAGKSNQLRKGKVLEKKAHRVGKHHFYG